MAAADACMLAAVMVPGTIGMFLSRWGYSLDTHHRRMLVFHSLQSHAVQRHDGVGESRQSIDYAANISHPHNLPRIEAETRAYK